MHLWTINGIYTVGRGATRAHVVVSPQIPLQALTWHSPRLPRWLSVITRIAEEMFATKITRACAKAYLHESLLLSDRCGFDTRWLLLLSDINTARARGSFAARVHGKRPPKQPST